MATDENGSNTDTPAPARRSMTVGIVADSGFASAVADAVETRLPEQVTIDGECVAVTLSRSSVTLPPSETGSAPVAQWLESVEASNPHDVVLFVSEIPRRVRSKPVVAELHAGTTAALYIPAFGALRTRGRALDVAVAVVHHLLGTDESSRPPLRRSTARWAPTPDTDDAHERVLMAPGFLGRLRLVAGMIRCNRPWRLVPTLSGALAAASAASAFGVFYASIWQMAASMSTLRLAAITVAAVAAMTLWLIFPHGLWEGRGFRSSATDRWMYNGATVGTVLSGVVLMYGVLFGAVLTAAAVVISPQFLSTQLDRGATPYDYVALAWLAASLGTVAGAVGSSVSDRNDILSATYGHREVMRRQTMQEE